MKKLIIIFLIMGILSGCKQDYEANNFGLRLRTSLQSSQSCSFDAFITADYGDSTCEFLLHNEVSDKINLNFTVLQPDTIEGITGRISQDGGHLTFDDKVLLMQLLIDGELTPVCAPWLMYKTLTGGIIRAAESDSGRQIIYDDVFRGEPYQMYAQFDEAGYPQLCEFVWNGRRFMTVEVKNFKIL